MVGQDIIKDIILKGDVWMDLNNRLSEIFKTKPVYDIFMICASIGILLDKTVEKLESTSADDTKTIPRIVVQKQVSELLTMFQSAILTTKTIEHDEDTRLKIAFSDNHCDFPIIKFLVKFANYGATRLIEHVAEWSIATMDSLNEFFKKIADENDLKARNDILDEINEAISY